LQVASHSPITPKETTTVQTTRYLRLTAAMTAVTLLTVPTVATAAPTSDAGHQPAATTSDCIPAPLALAAGEEALVSLGEDLEEVAEELGLTSEQLAEELVEDQTLHVDTCGTLVYVESAQDLGVGRDAHDGHDHATYGNDGHDHPRQSHDGQHDPDVHDDHETEVALAAIAASSDALALESLPGANRVIHLDFDGHSLYGTYWNTTYSLPNGHRLASFDLDGNPSSFSAAEREFIKEAWASVAEDFAPFAVNVTTKDPGLEAILRSSDADQIYGVRSVVTPDQLMASRCGCAGVAVIGSYGMSTDTPTLTLAAYADDPDDLASVISHETGHALRLRHHGTSSSEYYQGHGHWAPLMGAGYLPLSTWSRGEYAGANRTDQDDLAVIASNGAPLRTDDHGNTAAAATVLTLGTPRPGIIHTRTDVDVFSFTASGHTRIRVANAAGSPNLDVKATLRDSAGTLVATYDPPAGLDMSEWPFRLTGTDVEAVRVLASGSYRLHVEGTGFGDPRTTGYSDYASLGGYTVLVEPLTLTISPASAPTAGRNTSYRLQLSSEYGTAPFTYAVSSGSLPTGLALSSAGVISGTPTTAGTSTFAVASTDAAGRTGTRSYSLAVSNPPAPVTTLAVTARRHGSVVVGWSPPASSATTLRTGYEVWVDGWLSDTIAADATSHEVHIWSSSSFTVEVRPVGPGGSAPSTPVTATNLEGEAQAPPAPTSLTAKQTAEGFVQLSWPAVADTDLAPLSHYRVLRSGTLLTTVTSPGYLDPVFLPGTSLTYAVSAVGPGGTSAQRSTSITMIDQPNPISTLGVQAGASSVALSWTAPATSTTRPRTGYRVYVDGALRDTIGSSSTGFTVSSLTAGRSYTFSVRPYNSYSEAWGPTVSATPGGQLPAELAALNAKAGSTTVALSWSSPATSTTQPRTGYRVYVDGVLSATIGSSATSHTVASLTNGRTYRFSVRPYNSAGETTGASVSSTPVAAPVAPVSITAAQRDRAFAVSWPAVTSTAAAPVTGYRVLRDGTQVYQGTATSFSMTGLTAGQTYSVSVVTYGPGGVSSRRSVSRVAITVPGAQRGVSVSARSTSLVVSWTGTTSTTARPVSGYEVLLNDRSVARVSASTRSYTISSLSRNTAYKVTVRPYNPAGVGTSMSVSTRTLS
jgi:hypothetical protein